MQIILQHGRDQTMYSPQQSVTRHSSMIANEVQGCCTFYMALMLIFYIEVNQAIIICQFCAIFFPDVNNATIIKDDRENNNNT